MPRTGPRRRKTRKYCQELQELKEQRKQNEQKEVILKEKKKEIDLNQKENLPQFSDNTLFNSIVSNFNSSLSQGKSIVMEINDIDISHKIDEKLDSCNGNTVGEKESENGTPIKKKQKINLKDFFAANKKKEELKKETQKPKVSQKEKLSVHSKSFKTETKISKQSVNNNNNNDSRKIDEKKLLKPRKIEDFFMLIRKQKSDLQQKENEMKEEQNKIVNDDKIDLKDVIDINEDADDDEIIIDIDSDDIEETKEQEDIKKPKQPKELKSQKNEKKESKPLRTKVKTRNQSMLNSKVHQEKKVKKQESYISSESSESESFQSSISSDSSIKYSRKHQKEKKPKQTKQKNKSKQIKQVTKALKTKESSSSHNTKQVKTNPQSEESVSDSLKSVSKTHVLALTQKNLCNQGKESSVRIKERDRRIVQWMENKMNIKDLLPYPKPMFSLSDLYIDI